MKTWDAVVENLVASYGPDLRVATPLGLGKPNGLLNALYRRVAGDPSLKLTIFTALSLARPRASNELAKRFLEPFVQRQWGEHYEDLDYAKAACSDRLPDNIRVHEFFFQAGSAMRSLTLQRNYQAIHYTHVVNRLVDEKPRIVLQLVARRANGRYSLGSNPDLTRDLVDVFRDRGLPLAVVGVVHPEMPFVGGDAEVGEDFFTTIVDDRVPVSRLFALPRSPVDATDHAIGFHASRLVVDDGTLQVGIGSLSDAIVAALICRHEKNPIYRELLGDLATDANASPFAKGLYGLSEMVMDGFMHLRRAGVLKRTVSDGSYLLGAFFLGSANFYQWLRTLEGEDYEGLRMGRISQVNHLFDIEPHSKWRERKNARFFNTCMQVTLLGGAASDTLPDGRVVCGVGGQYNFVAMAHELRDARSILMLRSTREREGKRESNVVWSHGHLTIPRQLRDIVVTEYGVADVRGKTDEETIMAILAITDSEFQPGLLQKAKNGGKVDPNREIPASARNNTPASVAKFIARGRAQGLFASYPWGSDFTPEEEKIAAALDFMKSRPKLAYWVRKSLGVSRHGYRAELRRMGLESVRGAKQWLARQALVAALHAVVRGTPGPN